MEQSDFLQNHTLLYTSTTEMVEDIRARFAKLPFRNAYFEGKDFMAPFYFLLLAFGIASNILNIVVYTKIGAKDNVTVSFLTLSISDLLYLVLLTPHLTVDALLHLVEFRMGRKVKWLFDNQILRYPFYWYAFTFYEVSILINVYISVVRCACVAIPFTVKSMFTVRRAIITFVIFFLSIFALRFPMFMTKRIIQQFDPAINRTVFVYKELEDGGLADKLNDIVSRNLLTWTSFVTVIISLGVMIFKLQASAKFRSSVYTNNSSTSGDKKNIDHVQKSGQADASSCKQNIFYKNGSASDQLDDSKICPQETNYQGPAKDLSPKPDSFERNKTVSAPGTVKEVLSSKEAQVVRSVVLVACVFVTCQVPFMAYSLARRIESQFDDSIGRSVSRYVYLFALCSTISKIFAMINASVNIVVYYNFSSRYRNCIKSLWKRK